MGVMGSVEYLISNLCSSDRRSGGRRPMQTVEMKVKMDCEGCERRVRETARNMRGVKKVEVNRKESKVTVTGHVDDPNLVVKRLMRRTGKRAELWPYVPQQFVYFPFTAYDKRAPAGHVKNLRHAFPGPATDDERFTSLFSDDNVNACSIM